jgi:hypothetical protein
MQIHFYAADRMRRASADHGRSTPGQLQASARKRERQIARAEAEAAEARDLGISVGQLRWRKYDEGMRFKNASFGVAYRSTRPTQPIRPIVGNF